MGLATVLFAIVTVIWVYLAPSGSSRGWSLLALGLAVAVAAAALYYYSSSSAPTAEAIRAVYLKLRKALFGVLALGVVIYASYAVLQTASSAAGGWSDAWSYVGYVLAALAALVLLAIVWVWFGDLIQAQTGLLGVVVQLVFALPCFIAWLAQYAVNDFHGTAPATILLLAAETALLGAFAFRGPLERAGRQLASWVLPAGLLIPTDRVTTRLQTDRVFLNYETRLGNRPLPEDNGAPETRAKTMLTPARSLGQNQDYRVTFEVFLHALDLGAGAAFPVLRYADGGGGGGGGCPSVYFEGAGVPGAGAGRIWRPSGEVEGFQQLSKKQKKEDVVATIKKAPVIAAAAAAAVKKKKNKNGVGTAAADTADTAADTAAAAADTADTAASTTAASNNATIAADIVATKTTAAATAEDAAAPVDEDAFVPDVLAVDNQRNSAQLRVYLTNTGTDDAVLITAPLQRWVELAFYYTRTQVDVFVDRRLVHSLSWRPDNRPAFGPGDRFVLGSPVPNGAALGSLRNLAVETPYPLIHKYGPS